MPDCVPPQALATWSTVLLSETIALGVEALALLFTLRLVRGGSWGWLAMRGLLFAGALAVAAWSLVIFTSAQTIYQSYVTLFDWNPDACYGGLHAPPGAHTAFMRNMQAVSAPIEHTAAIASGASAALLIAGVYLLALWMRRWRAAAQSEAGIESMESVESMDSDDWRRERIV